MSPKIGSSEEPLPYFIYHGETLPAPQDVPGHFGPDLSARIQELSQNPAGPWNICRACLQIIHNNLVRLSPGPYALYSDIYNDWTPNFPLASAIEFADAGCRFCRLIALSFINVSLDGLDLDDFHVSAQLTTDISKLQLFCVNRYIDNGKHLELTRRSPHEMTNILGLYEENPRLIRRSTFAQLQSWLSECLQKHKKCHSSYELISFSRRLPTRLLEVKKEDGSVSVRVVETGPLPLNAQYLTLSHCWGTKRYAALTSATFSAFLKSVPWETLPKTFKDAIQTTILLGFHYIWIDSLCIIQDSHSDWKQEALMMDQVYEFGILNLSANAALDGDGGLFRQEYKNFAVFNVKEDNRVSHFECHLANDWERNVEESPLGQRGWVLQERILSPRSVHFSQDQIYWECCQERFAELYTANIGPFSHNGARKGLPEENIYNDWLNLVERYSHCQLTFSTDKLIAFAGLARRTCTQLCISPSDYLAGLWRPKIYEQLFWKSTTFYYGKAHPAPDLVRAPSWSWASVDDPIEFNSETPRTIYFKIIEVETLYDNDPFGLSTGGYLLIQAPLCLLGTNP